MTKSLTSKLHLKHRLCSHCMAEGTSLEEHRTTFKEIIANLETLEVKYEDEDLGLMLSCLLPNSYATFRDTILYSLDTLTLNEVYEALLSKEKMKQLIVRPKAHEDSLFVRGRPQKKNYGEEQRKMSKSKNFNKIYNYCNKKDHIKECFKLKNKENQFENKQGKKSRKSSEASVVESYQTDGVTPQNHGINFCTSFFNNVRERCP